LCKAQLTVVVVTRRWLRGLAGPADHSTARIAPRVSRYTT
jgi:hypothetical protein